MSESNTRPKSYELPALTAELMAHSNLYLLYILLEVN